MPTTVRIEDHAAYRALRTVIATSGTRELRRHVLLPAGATEHVRGVVEKALAGCTLTPRTFTVIVDQVIDDLD